MDVSDRARPVDRGVGDDPESAVADLREALIGLIEEFGPTQELSLTLNVA